MQHKTWISSLSIECSIDSSCQEASLLYAFLPRTWMKHKLRPCIIFYFYSETSAFHGPSVTRRHGAYPQLPASIVLIQVILPISLSNTTNKHTERQKNVCAWTRTGRRQGWCEGPDIFPKIPKTKFKAQ